MSREKQNGTNQRGRRRGEDRAVIAAAADMTDAGSMSRFVSECRQSLKFRPLLMVIDLKHVERADTKLVASLVFLFREAQRLAVRVEFRMSGAAEAVIRLCRLDDMISEEAHE